MSSYPGLGNEDAGNERNPELTCSKGARLPKTNKHRDGDTAGEGVGFLDDDQGRPFGEGYWREKGLLGQMRWILGDMVPQWEEK